MTTQGFNEINHAAFAAEQAQVSKDIADRNAKQAAPQNQAINALAHTLGQAGVPRAAAGVIASRIVELETKLARLESYINPGYTPQGLETR